MYINIELLVDLTHQQRSFQSIGNIDLKRIESIDQSQRYGVNRVICDLGYEYFSRVYL